MVQVAERRRSLAPLRLRDLEELVLAQANVGENGKSKNEKSKNVYNNKIILILYYI